MEKIIGIPAAEVLGQVAFERFPSLVKSGDDQYFRAALRGGHAVTEERHYDVPETGVRGWFTAAYSPLLAENGEVIGGLSVYRDVTAAKEADGLRRKRCTTLSPGWPTRPCSSSDCSMHWLGWSATPGQWRSCPLASTGSSR